MAPFPKRADLVNVAYDLIGGFWSLFTLRTARLAEGVGGEIKVANRIMFVSAFNPVGGLSDVYSVRVWNLIRDYGATTNFDGIVSQITPAADGVVGYWDMTANNRVETSV
jgi:hypothetical protein